MDADTLVINRIDEVDDVVGAIRAAEEIFFAASLTQSFADDTTRAAFRHKWFGLYLDAFRNHFYVAQRGGRTIGYLAGCVSEPLSDPRMADHDYYTAFAELLPAYPAHLHINMETGARSNGFGTQLIEIFVQRCVEDGVCGVHVVTGQESRNLPFYRRAGFSCEVPRNRSDGAQLFLGRALG